MAGIHHKIRPVVAGPAAAPSGPWRSKSPTSPPATIARRPDGVFAAPYKQGEIGSDLFRAACNWGLEGIVSERVDRPYRAARSKEWVKVKNRKHPA